MRQLGGGGAEDSVNGRDAGMPGRATRAHVIGTWVMITLCASSAAVLTRYAEVPAASIGFWRVFGAGVILLPWWWKAWRAAGQPRIVSVGALVSGVALGIHFATWCWAIQHTSIANAALFIGLQPLIIPFIAHALIREKLNAWELVGSALALVGSLWIMGRQVAFARGDLAGSLAAMFSTGWCGLYFVFGRKYRGQEHVMLFSVPVYFVAAAVQAVASCVLSGGIFAGHGWTPVALLALILVPTVGGHTLAMYLLRHAKAQTLSLSVPAQFAISVIAAWILFGEVPPVWFYPGAALVLAGVTIGVVFGEGSVPAEM